MTKTKRIGPGAYTIIDQSTGRTCTVYREHNLPQRQQWIARADWTRDLYTDPCPTKANALQQTTYFFEEAVRDDLRGKVSVNEQRHAPKDMGYGACPHGDWSCPLGTDCRNERCTKCGKTWHVLGARLGSGCCNARLVTVDA